MGALPLFETVTEQRDHAMARVAQKAEHIRPTFGDDARAFVLAYLKEHGETSGEALTLACKKAGIAPHDDRAFGPVYFTLSQRGQIVKVGEVKRMRGHGTGGGIVWALSNSNR
jgi:hypothetical protein